MLAKHKDTYLSGLTAFRDGDVDRWLAIFAEAAAAAAGLAQRYLELLAGLQERWREELRTIQPRSDAAAWSIIDLLPAHPVITVNTAMAATERTRPAVANALDQLAVTGVLLPLAGSPKNRAWEAAGLLELIADLEAGQ